MSKLSNKLSGLGYFQHNVHMLQVGHLSLGLSFMWRDPNRRMYFWDSVEADLNHLNLQQDY